MEARIDKHVCAVCGADVNRKPSFWKRLKGKPCCSKKCRGEYLKTAYLGIQNPNFHDGTVIERFFKDKEKRLKHTAEQRGLSFGLTWQNLLAQYTTQNGLCWYTGIPMKMKSSNWSETKQADIDVLSVDRVDSTLGYTPDNIVLCCGGVNKLKGVSDSDDAVAFISLIASSQKERCKIKVKKLRDNATLPYKVGLGDVGYDLTAANVEDFGDKIKVFTGISVQPEIGWFVEVYPRSSVTKKDLMLMNSVGIIDNSYTGEIVLVFLKTESTASISRGERVAQLIARRYAMVDIVQVDSLDSTARGAGGFGSTGI